ncbi:MAG: hemerythrin domain-containing protein [Gemmatimonadota bacterium]|nr:MAG: hemerythrin domain-containing protein [Gemmatimonadota bacterium]
MTPPDGATTVLREEHRLILAVTGVLEKLLDARADGDPLDIDAVESCTTFFRLFADACHHGKEEDLLFTELENHGLSRSMGPLAVMLYEHRQGRELVGGMWEALDGARSGDGDAMRRLVTSGRGYIDLIRGHILKEDNVLFEMADNMVTGPACERLCDAYDGACRREFDGCTKAQLEGIAADLVERFA